MARPQALVFEGRPGRLAPAAMIGFLCVFIAVALFVSFTPAVDIYGRIFLWMFAALLIAFSCLIAIASSRRRTFELDDERIRCTGRPRANFDVAWKDVTRIEILRYRRGAPLAYVLRGPNGAILATFSPGELGAAAGESLALAVEKNAHNVGLPIVRPY